METVFTVTVNVTDSNTYEVSSVYIAINDIGCIYPSITIEEEGKVRQHPLVKYKTNSKGEFSEASAFPTK